MGWCSPPWASPAPRVGNPRGGGASTCLGRQGTPLGRRLPLEIQSPRVGAPLGTLYKEGGGRAAAPLHLAPPFLLATPLPSVDAWRSPAGVSATSTTTPSCCWIIINLSFPLAGSRWRRRHADHTCVECGGAVRSALGSPVIGSRRERLPQPRSLERFRTRSTSGM